MKRILLACSVMIPTALSSSSAEQTYTFEGRSLSEQGAQEFLAQGPALDRMKDMQFLYEYKPFDPQKGITTASALLAKADEIQAQARSLKAPTPDEEGARQLVNLGVLVIRSAGAYHAELLLLRKEMTEIAVDPTLPSSLQNRLDFLARYYDVDALNRTPIGDRCSHAYYFEHQIPGFNESFVALFPSLRLYLILSGKYKGFAPPGDKVLPLLNKIDEALSTAFPGILDSSSNASEPQSLPQALCWTVKEFKSYRFQEQVKDCAANVPGGSCVFGFHNGAKMNPKSFTLPDVKQLLQQFPD